MQCRIPFTSLDHILIEKVKELCDKLYQKRMLIRLIGIRFSHLVHGNYQYSLFENFTQQILLYQAMDKMRNRFGKNAIQRAVGLGIKQNDFNRSMACGVKFLTQRNGVNEASQMVRITNLE